MGTRGRPCSRPGRIGGSALTSSGVVNEQVNAVGGRLAGMGLRGGVGPLQRRRTKKKLTPPRPS
jgi:hypothetical protein